MGKNWEFPISHSHRFPIGNGKWEMQPGNGMVFTLFVL